MTNCAICGRKLSNPASVAAGIGPVCGGRSYKGRIMRRYGSRICGWSRLPEWEVINRPCYTCKFFSVPPKKGETEIKTGYRVTIKGLSQDFPSEAIGGYCSKHRSLVDGNLIGNKTFCYGKNFEVRDYKKREPATNWNICGWRNSANPTFRGTSQHFDLT